MPVSRDYTQEVGIPDNKKRIPRPLAYAILAVVAVGVSFGVAGVISETKEHHAEENAAKAPPAAKSVEPVATPTDAPKPADPAK